MAWSIADPFDAKATGELITAAIWNQNVIDNPSFLKGISGTIELEDSVVSDTHNTDDLGTAAKQWKDNYSVRSWGGRMLTNPSQKREVRIVWEVKDENANSQPDVAVTYTETASGSTIRGGGTGQVVMEVDDDAGGARSTEIEQETEQNNAQGNEWTVSKKPYMRAEFSLDAERSTGGIFIGFRTTPGIAIPTGAEHHAGIAWTGTDWVVTHGGGTTATASLVTSPTVAARNVVEIYVNGSTDLEIWINGVRETVITANLPTSALEWHILSETDGAGGATSTRLTVGQLIFQEDVP